MDPLANNYDGTATKEDGSCEYPWECASWQPEVCPAEEIQTRTCSCTSEDKSQCTGDNSTERSCEFGETPGCTDEDALNYNEAATVDDDSCEYSGCTDPEADNYDEVVVEDDGSCEYSIQEVPEI
ncbi:hypothetical protein ACFLZ6_01515, partial [Nanoarchaeota archaeon]